MSTRLACLLATGVFACACTTHEPASNEAVSPTGLARTADPPQRRSDIEQDVAGVLEHIAGLRNLPPKGPVLSRETTRREMSVWLRQQLATDIPPAAIQGNAAFLVALGLVGPSFDYEATLERLMTSELAGFYDPKTKTMHVLSDLGAEDRRTTLNHELVHALQDQHFDLQRLTAWRSDASDKQSAVHALAEGDATSAMLEALLPAGQHAHDLPDSLLEIQAETALTLGANADVPGIIKRSLMAPYIDGLALVHWARRRGGWSSVDDLWRRIPSSSEQVLHPEKWLSNEQPEPVSVPQAFGAGPSELLYHDVFGEQSLRILLEEWLPKAAARTAASNWAGDKLAIFHSGELWSLAWHLRFDDAPSAERARVALHRGLLAEREQLGAALSLEQAQTAIRQRNICQQRDALGAIAVAGRDRSVVVVAGPYLKRGDQIRGASDCRAALAWAEEILNAPTGSGQPSDTSAAP